MWVGLGLGSRGDYRTIGGDMARLRYGVRGAAYRCLLMWLFTAATAAVPTFSGCVRTLSLDRS